MAKSFEAQISDWVRKTQRRTEGVFKESAQELFRIAQTPVKAGGHMPIVDGFLRDSLQTGLNGSEGVKGEDSYEVAIGGALIGDTIQGGWTAEYAVKVHYNGKDGVPYLWRDLAAEQWQEIVARNARKAEALNS